MNNPWEDISLSDYENHMSLGSVMQLQTLNSFMKDQFEAFPVDTAIVLGVAGGNGLEHIDTDKYRTVYGIDINEDYLKESVDCVLNQTLSDLELICVDDGSVDSSLEMLNEFAKEDNRIQVYHQENKGGGAARNLAITKATGEYMYCMDADDSIELTALQELYDIATEP